MRINENFYFYMNMCEQLKLKRYLLDCGIYDVSLKGFKKIILLFSQ